MSTRARTRAATAASTSKAAPVVPVKSQSKPKSQSRKDAHTPADSHQPEEKENVKAKGVKTPAKVPPKAVATTAQKRSTRSTPAVHCICKKGDDGTPMIQCGECRTWYHFECVDLKEEDAEDIKIYICSSCAMATGLRTTMTWEGEDALEHANAKPTRITKKEPATKKIRRDSPVEPPASESDGGASSEDEYLAEDTAIKGKGIAKRPRRLSYSSESDSQESDHAKSRRHRINKAPGSPPSTLKRKSQRVTHTPPPKRKRSDAAVSTDDPARKYCVTKLEELFRDVFFRYPHVRVEDGGGEMSLVQRPLDELTEDEKTSLLDESKQFADELERCVFDIYSEQDKSGYPSAGSNYKDRFRMLQFNLSKVDRVVIHQRIVSAEITPKEISLMSSTDLANEETKQSIKIAEKEALAYSILKPTTAPRAKITHKGLEDIEDVHGGVTTVQDEERLRREDEERIETELLARLKPQSRQRTASASIPPESPLDAVAQSQQPWGGPPAVPLRALLPNVALPSFPTMFSNESSPVTPSFSQSFPDASEPELNLADFINIDEEVPIVPTAPTVPVSSPPSTQTSFDESAPPSQTLSEPSPLSPTGISPFAQKSEPSRSMSFDLNALWSAPKTESATSPPTSEEGPVASTSSPQVTADDKDAIMDIEGGGADDFDFDMFLEEKDSGNSPEAQQAALDALPHVWTGKINMPLDSTIPQEISVNARQIGGRPLEHESVLWKTLFPSELLRIDGRVPVENSGKFLLQMRMNSAKELIAVAFSPSPEAGDVGFRILSDFLIAKGRHGLVFPWGPKPKEHHPGRELYIIPLLSSDPLPEYMELLDNLHLPKARTVNLLIGIWILNKGRLAPPPAPPTPAIPSFPPTQQHAQPPSIPPTLPFPHVSPPAPSFPANIAAEVASLTPEQIQLMIQTLTAHGTIPLPVIPPQNQPQGHQPHPDVPPSVPPSMIPPRQHPHIYPPHPQHPHQPYNGYGGGMYQPPPIHRPAPLSWDRPGDNHPGSIYDRDDRGGRGWRGRGSATGNRGRGRGNDAPQPVDSGWPRRPHNDSGPGSSSPTRRW